MRVSSIRMEWDNFKIFGTNVYNNENVKKTYDTVNAPNRETLYHTCSRYLMTMNNGPNLHHFMAPYQYSGSIVDKNGAKYSMLFSNTFNAAFRSIAIQNPIFANIPGLPYFWRLSGLDYCFNSDKGLQNDFEKKLHAENRPNWYIGRFGWMGKFLNFTRGAPFIKLHSMPIIEQNPTQIDQSPFIEISSDTNN